MSSSVSDSAFAVEVLTKPDELEGLAGTWKGLLRLTPGPSGFQSLPWVRACWEHLARSGDELFVTTVSRDGEPVAIFPTKLSRGSLTFIGGGVSNYSGPVYDPEHASEAIAAWTEYVVSEQRIAAVDLFGLREGTPAFVLLRSASIGAWGGPLVSKTNVCPESDLRPGWEAVAGRHKSKQRATWRRKERRLEGLGDLRFEETEDPDEILAAMPRLTSLFAARWAGQRISGGLSRELEPFHAATVRYASPEGHLRLSTLVLDGEIVAFSYGVRAGDVTSSYLLAHDRRFDAYSVGLLLVIHVLEAAARRGDPAYDFSLGTAEYKSLWASRERDVYRLFWGRRRWPAFLWSSAWVRARSVPWMRELKRGGVRALLPRRGASTGQSGPTGTHSTSRFVSRVAGSEEVDLTFHQGSYAVLSRHLPADLLEQAIERHFRGDEALVAEDRAGFFGVVWRAAKGRREAVSGGGAELGETDVVYYDPVVRNDDSLETLLLGLPGRRPYLVVTSRSPKPVPGIVAAGQFSGAPASAGGDSAAS